MCGVPVSPRTARGVWVCRVRGDDVTSPVRHLVILCAASVVVVVVVVVVGVVTRNLS